LNHYNVIVQIFQRPSSVDSYIRKDKWVIPKFNQYIFHLANYYH